MEHGYESAFNYHRGIISKREKMLGWKGNNRNVTTEFVDNDVSTFSTLKDCPGIKDHRNSYAFALFEKIRYNLDYKLTKSVYPFGRCCQAKIPGSPLGSLANIAIVGMNIRVSICYN